MSGKQRGYVAHALQIFRTGKESTRSFRANTIHITQGENSVEISLDQAAECAAQILRLAETDPDEQRTAQNP